MILELSEKNTLEKYEKILIEKNKNYDFHYILKTVENNLIISVFTENNYNILKDMSNPIAEFFKEILSEAKFQENNSVLK